MHLTHPLLTITPFIALVIVALLTLTGLALAFIGLRDVCNPKAPDGWRAKLVGPIGVAMLVLSAAVVLSAAWKL